MHQKYIHTWWSRVTFSRTKLFKEFEVPFDTRKRDLNHARRNGHLSWNNISWAYQNYLIKICQISYLFPQGEHDVEIFLIPIVIKFALAFDQRHSQCHAFKIVLVQISIVIYICSYTGRSSLKCTSFWIVDYLSNFE